MIGNISPLSSLSTFGLILPGPAAFSGRNFESNLFIPFSPMLICSWTHRDSTRFSLALNICESWALFFVSSWCVTLIRVFLYVIPQSLIQFYPESGIQNNKCATVNILSHGTKITVVVLRCSLIKFYTVPPRCVFFLKSMINNPEFRQFILQVQSGVIYFYNLNNNF